MKRCWNSPKKIIEIRFVHIFCNVCGILGIGIDIYYIYYMINGFEDMINIADIITSFVLLGIGIALIWLGLVFYRVDFRQYSMDEEGITIIYLNKHEQIYNWNEVSEISFCDVHTASRSLAHDRAIRIVFGTEMNGPSNKKCSVDPLSGLEHWRGEFYELKHLRQVLTIEYSREELIRIKELSGKEIKDYRSKSVRQYAWKEL